MEHVHSNLFDTEVVRLAALNASTVRPASNNKTKNEALEVINLLDQTYESIFCFDAIEFLYNAGWLCDRILEVLIKKGFNGLVIKQFKARYECYPFLNLISQGHIYFIRDVIFHYINTGYVLREEVLTLVESGLIEILNGNNGYVRSRYSSINDLKEAKRTLEDIKKGLLQIKVSGYIL